MNWLKRLLGIGDTTGPRHGEFIFDLGGEALRHQFEYLVGDSKRAGQILSENGWGEVNRDEFEDVVLLHVAIQGGFVTSTDWAALPAEILHDFANLASRLEMPSIPKDVYKFGAEIKDTAEIGDHVALLYPRIARWANGCGFSIANLNMGSDTYHFCIFTPEMSRKWAEKHISKNLVVQDLGAVFS